MTDLSCHSCHNSNNSLQDLFERSLNRFLDEPGHLSALEMLLNDSSYLKGSLQSSSGSHRCQESHRLDVSSSTFELEMSHELVKEQVAETNPALQEDMEEIKKLREEKLKLERDLKAKRERKKRRAQKKKKRKMLEKGKTEEESPEHEKSALKNKDDSDQEKSPKKIKDDDQTQLDRKEKESPLISKRKSHQNREEACLEKTNTQRKEESLTLRELYTDSGSLLLEGYIRVDGNRRRHSSHERSTYAFPNFTKKDQIGTNKEKESLSKLSAGEHSNPKREMRRHSSRDVSGKPPARSTSCPIQEITIVRKSKRDQSKMEALLPEEETKFKSKDKDGNNKHGKNVKQAKKEVTNKQETTPKTTKISEDALVEAELNALNEKEAREAALKQKEERLKKFEKERGSSTSPRIRSKKKPGLANNPPPKCILDALNWATRNGLFGANNDQTRRARMIASHRREKFEELISEYDKGLIRRRHSVSS